MRRWIPVVLVPLLVACSGGADADRGGAGGGGGETAADLEPLVRLYESRRYFSLRDRLEARGEPAEAEPPGLRVLRAAVAHAFNEPERSNALLDPILAPGGGGASDSLRYEARRIRFRNLLRLHRYADAGAVLSALLAETPEFVDSARVRDFRNTSRITDAVADVPPQRVVRRSAAKLRRLGRGHVEVALGDSVRDYPIDTGANLSLLIRSEAEALGLEVRPAGVELGTSTDVRVTADLAVADRMALGGIELRNVLFLVVSDEVMTFPGLVIRGLIGFPVVEALGELRFRRDGPIQVPAEVPARSLRNLALHQLTPLVRVGYRADTLLCRFDTGANDTEFYEPFLRRHRRPIEAAGTPDTARMGGAGGVRQLPGYRIEDVPLELGGIRVTLPDAHVHTRVLVQSEEENFLDCNIGHDVLAGLDEYVLNFRSMSLLLRGSGGPDG